MISTRPWRFCACFLAAFVVAFCLASPSQATIATIVRFDTVLGSFDVQLFDDAMPVTVANFLGYVNSGRYDGTVVHRSDDTSDPVLRDFVIQGGGFTLFDPNPPNPNAIISFGSVNTDPPINDEPGGGIAGPSNVRGTIAMAKSGPNTVTSQWFINQGDNSFLDNPARSDGGFSAFGKVLGNGMDIVDAIGDLPRPMDFDFEIDSPFNDLPLRDFSGSAANDIRVENTVTVNSISVLDLEAGDFDRDGNVDTEDLDIFQSGFGMTSGAFLDDGDADRDGNVDGNDFLAWQRTFGQSAALAASQAVPEPTTGALAAMAAAALLLRRYRLAATR